jgi:adenylate kinase
MKSDVIIFDLDSADHDEVEFAIKTLKTAEITNQSQSKTLILISSLMTWSNTPEKFETIDSSDEKPKKGQKSK